MPEAVVAAVEFIATTGIEIAGFDISTSTLLAFAATSSYTQSQRRRMQARARDAYNASLRDRTITVRGTLEERDLVMGRIRKGGYFYPIGTTGADSERMVFIVVMAGHSCAGVNTNYFNDEALTLDGDGWVTSAPYSTSAPISATEDLTLSAGAGSVTLAHAPISGSVQIVFSNGAVGEAASSVSTTPTSVSGSTVSVTGWSTYTGTAQVLYQYNESTSHARIRWMMGGSSQAAFGDLITDFPTLWTSAHRLRGCTYAVIEVLYSPDVFPSGLPNFSADINGADTVEDPRTSTVGFSENNALLARWYALHPMGGRRTTAQLDEPSFIAAANVCDTSVNYGDGSTALYKAGYVAKAGQVPAEVFDELCEGMAGRWGYTQGKVRVRAGAVGSAVASIDSTWLLTRRMSVRPRRSRTDLRNVLQGTFADSANGYQALQFTRVVDSPAVADDGAELVGDVEFQAITRNAQCQQVAACMLRYERQALTITLTLKMRAYGLQLFDVVAITLPDLGWTSKLFEVVDRSWALGGGLQYTFKETHSSIYTFGSSFPVVDPAPNTELPSPTDVPTVGTITATSTASELQDRSVVTRVRMSWPDVGSRAVAEGGYIEVAWMDAIEPAEFQVARADSLTGHTLVGLRSGVHYALKARAVNGIGVHGKWSAQILHLVAGRRAVVTYRQSTTPVGAIDGDLWVDDANANLVKRRESGAWVSMPFGTGAMAANAATEVYVDTPSSAVTITGEMHTPRGFNPLYATPMASVTFTPSASGEAAVFFEASGQVVNSDPSGATYAEWSIQDAGGTWDGWKRVYVTAAAGGATGRFPMASTRRIAVMGGTTYTFKAYASKYHAADTFTADSIEMRVEVIKR